MATTALFVEILIIGFQSLTWMALLAASIFGIDTISIYNFTGWQTLLIMFALVVAYVLGIVVDRLADTAFSELRKFLQFIAPKLLKEDGEDKSLPSFAEMRLQILMQSDAVSKFMDYQRSRLRIARATVFNLLLITICGVIFLSTRTSFSIHEIVMSAFIGLVLVAISLYVAFRIDAAQCVCLQA